MPFIDVIGESQAEGHLKAVYDSLLERRGQISNVFKIQSLNPVSIVNHLDLYMTLMFGSSPLKRAQREMIAVVVSVSNDCSYCIEHHSRALLQYWKDTDKVERLKSDFKELGLPAEESALCNFAQLLTEQPFKAGEKELAFSLKKEGLSDQAILDATMIIGYFNFVNRMVLALGVELEEDK